MDDPESREPARRPPVAATLDEGDGEHPAEHDAPESYAPDSYAPESFAPESFAPADYDAVSPPSAPPPSRSLTDPPEELLRRGPRPPPLVFRQGAHPPYGVRWYGVTSLYGHLRNFVARAIATESVDSRDWMRSQSPAELLATCASILRAPLADAPTLTEAMGRPVWIDFVADSGDDRDVSAAVGAMLAKSYRIEDDVGIRVLPRGDVLLLGGDVAYPVATADEIYRRLVLPWNEALRRAQASGTKRVLLGVPGNHDWYDGLDGFGRLVRRPVDEPFRADVRDTLPKIARRLEKRSGRNVGLVARQLHLDEVGTMVGWFGSITRSLRAFAAGEAKQRRRRLVLRGYEPAQEASYFVLPLAPGLDLFGGDRQLGRIDFRQRSFLTKRRRQFPDHAVLFASADPALAYGDRNDPGARMLESCGLALERDRIFYVAGDFHHYERRTIGRSTHIIAGGGGAFLHGTRISPYAVEPDCAYPDARTSRKLVFQAPLKLMAGRAGLLVHLLLAIVAATELAAAREGTRPLMVTSAVMSVAISLILMLIAGQNGKQRAAVATLSSLFGGALGVMPMALRLLLPRFGPDFATDGAVVVASAMLGALGFGLFYAVIAALGIEHQQAFTVLGHPGFKHLVRMCVYPDGRIEAFCIGKDDALAPRPAELIDYVEWEPQAPESPARAAQSARGSSSTNDTPTG